MARDLDIPEILPSDARFEVSNLQTPGALAPLTRAEGPPSASLVGGPRAGNNHVSTPWVTAVTKAVGFGDASGSAGGSYLVKAPAVADLQALAVSTGPDSLSFYAVHYLDAKVVGGSPHTLDACSRDLKTFITWFANAKGSVAVIAWRPRETRSFAAYLASKNLAPTTINRVLQTLRHFARWMQDTAALFGSSGLPTADVKDLSVEEPTCKKLTDEEVSALFGAAQSLVSALDTRRAAAAAQNSIDPTHRARPRRDFAMMALLYYCGLRASEQVILRRAQYMGTHLVDVARKGRNITRRLFLPPEGRAMLDDYLTNERNRDDAQGTTAALFVSTGPHKGYLLRTDLADALQRIANEANRHRPPHRQIRVTPHKFRHTFGARVRASTGSDSETAAALGHRSVNYVPRYTRKTDEERDAALEAALHL